MKAVAYARARRILRPSNQKSSIGILAILHETKDICSIEYTVHNSSWLFTFDDIISFPPTSSVLTLKAKETEEKFLLEVLIPTGVSRFRDVLIDCKIFIDAVKQLQRISNEIDLNFHQLPKDPDLPRAQSLRILCKETSTEQNNLLECNYCSMNKSNSPDCMMFIHPYVPSRFNGDSVVFCDICINNRAIFIENHPTSAETSNNESYCAICGCIPLKAVVCGSCPRSYCTPCLNDVLTKEELMIVHEASCWTCMCCYHGLPHYPDTTLTAVTKVYCDTNIIKGGYRSKLFADYVKERETQRIQFSPNMGSDEVCFTCKDGGTLYECDCSSSCRKVYHLTCLKEGPITSKTWVCPRHTCQQCSSKRALYSCTYSPFSVCVACFELHRDSIRLFNKRVRNETEGVVSILCNECYTRVRLLPKTYQERVLKRLR